VVWGGELRKWRAAVSILQQMLSLGDGGCFGAPKFPSGTFDIYASVGDADGTSVYELPIGGSDGHRRDKIGHCRFR
jgi:hypothetical protein